MTLQKILEERLQLLLEEVDKRLVEQRQLIANMLGVHHADHAPLGAHVPASPVMKPGVDLFRPLRPAESLNGAEAAESRESRLHTSQEQTLTTTWEATGPVSDETLVSTFEFASIPLPPSPKRMPQKERRHPKESTRFSRESSYEEAVKAEKRNERQYRGAPHLRVTVTNEIQTDSRVAQCVAPLVVTWQFEFFFAFLILSHAVLLGIQIEWEATNLGAQPPASMVYIHLGFTFCFLVEITLRMITSGLKKFFLTSSVYGWNIFDFTMVSLSIVELLADLILKENFASGAFRILRILRLARSARGLRIVRLIRYIRPLRILVFSIGITLKSLIWSIVLLVLIIYLFSILFSDAYLVSAQTMDLESATDLIKFFGSLQSSMLTLFAAISGGLEWRHAITSLTSLGWVWSYLFIVYIAFCCFAVLNVMTGVFCHSAITGAEQDHEFMVQSMVNEQARIRTVFGELFRQMDHDGSGMITIQEFEKGFRVEATRAWFEALGLKAEDAWTIFRSLDKDGDHKIGIVEFVEGCINIRGNAREVDLMRQSQMTQQRLQKMEGAVVDSVEILRHMMQQLSIESPFKETGSMMSRAESHASAEPVPTPQSPPAVPTSSLR